MPERARSRSRARRSGSRLEHWTLQYLAVCFFTGAAQPARAQIRRAAGERKGCATEAY